MPYLLLTFAFITNAAANVLLKLGAERSETDGLVNGFLHNWQALLGLFLFAINVVFYFLALRALPLSTAYPIMVGMSFFLATVGAAYLLGEPISWQHLVGYALILAGITIVVWYAR